MSDIVGDIVWRGMTRAQLDAAYNNGAAVADSAVRIADWAARSARLRERHPEALDLRYGPRERNRIDIFRSGAADAPLFVFIHGGYWQRNAKESFSFLAEGPMAAGIDAAMVGYTLAPDARLSEIVAETHAAIRWLKHEGPRHGVGRSKLVVSGWSAGGHLTAMAMGLPGVDAGLAISGIFDVEPCRLNYLTEKLRLSADEAAAMSPLSHLPSRSGPLAIAYGTHELPELQRQSRDYWQAWEGAGLPGRLLPLAGKNHYTIMEELAAPDGALTAALRSLLAACA
jgi:dipeptidyl aminopeptidase/acylaminoacyl peptidase